MCFGISIKIYYTYGIGIRFTHDSVLCAISFLYLLETQKAFKILSTVVKSEHASQYLIIVPSTQSIQENYVVLLYCAYGLL